MNITTVTSYREPVQMGQIDNINTEDIDVKVSVEFFQAIENSNQFDERFQEISDTRSFRVITWFIGEERLDRKWRKLLAGEFLPSFRSCFGSIDFIFYCLGNWMNLKNKEIERDVENCSTKGYETVQSIKSLNIKDISFIDSSSFFSFVKTCSCSETINYIANQVFTRNFIWSRSQDRTPIDVKIYELLGDCPMLRSIDNRDINQSYSALQYVEALYLIEKAILTADDPCDIIFFLPNDEYQYYLDEENSFQQDVANYLKLRGIDLSENLNILFVPFLWGDGGRQRPYKSNGKINPNNPESFKVFKSI